MDSFIRSKPNYPYRTIRRVGVLGYGNLGKFLVSKIIESSDYELAFVWNRTKSSFGESIDSSLILESIRDFKNKKPDIVVEVAHPSVTKTFGKEILSYCDFMIGSPTAFSDEDLLEELKLAAKLNGLYIPSGAFWGGEDIQKMSDAGILQVVCKISVNLLLKIQIQWQLLPYLHQT